METLIRLIITILFIGLIAIAIIFFTILVLAPTEKLGEILKKEEKVREVVVREKEVVIVLPPPVEEKKEPEVSEPEPLPPPPPPPPVPRKENDVALPVATSKIGVVDMLTFEIWGLAGRYDPPNIVVKENDIVRINFSAIDDDYDIFFPDYGVYKTVKAGETGRVQFQAYSAGEYEFFCRDACAKEVRGRFLVEPR